MWERLWEGFDRWGALVLLGASTLLSVFHPDLSTSGRLTILALVAGAAAWTVLVDIAAPASVRQRAWHPPVYLGGLLAFAALLMRESLPFFIFAIIGFFHAGRLRPKPLVFLGVAATSFVINLLTWGGLPRPTLDETLGFFALLTVQTVLIGSGILGGERVMELSEERQRTVRRLEATLGENEGLHAQLVAQAREAGVQEERQRLAQDIHDSLAQGFTGIITQLEAAKQADDPDALGRHLDTAAGLARRSLDEARRSVHALGPEALDRGRLVQALHDLAHDWSEVYGADVEVSADGSHAQLPAPLEVALLGVAREALNNTAKHADAQRVVVTLSVLDDRALLDVRDDGRGFDPDLTEPFAGTDDSTGFGLTTMRLRVERLGGRLTIETEPGSGTAISAEVPLETHHV